MVAVGARTAVHEAGLDVPGDVSLVGYDDIPFARDLRPRPHCGPRPVREAGPFRRPYGTGQTRGRPAEYLLRGTHVVVRDSLAQGGDDGR
ncbi:hypothetical protein PYK79_37785 [Streptomyces sp. ID05-04B]|uniref:hypothetical protein n=1 Tax=Streptomyces sp. P3 TaxID=2135430 RepID=UPI0020B15A16|nr:MULTISPECIES: hypothetical protein [unclassified Streptomyces]MDX5567860.1 hypothetical protein [Streptomyces sp. ID05-04B]